MFCGAWLNRGGPHFVQGIRYINLHWFFKKLFLITNFFENIYKYIKLSGSIYDIDEQNSSLLWFIFDNLLYYYI